MPTPTPNETVPQADRTPLDDLLDQDQGLGSDEEKTPEAEGNRTHETPETPADGDKTPETPETHVEGDKEKPAEGDKPEEGVSDIDTLKKEMREMRGLLREQRNKNMELQNDLAAARKELTESGHLAERSEEEVKALRDKQQARQDELETYLENMRLSNRYADVDQVVTQGRADDLIEMMARQYADKNKVALDSAIQEMRTYVWFQTKNSYRFLYDAIKKAHPDFVKKDDDAGSGKKGAPSLANVPGGDGGKGKGVKDGQWTAEQIDALPEDELEKVPADVYSKYMRGELE